MITIRFNHEGADIEILVNEPEEAAAQVKAAIDALENRKTEKPRTRLGDPGEINAYPSKPHTNPGYPMWGGIQHPVCLHCGNRHPLGAWCGQYTMNTATPV